MGFAGFKKKKSFFLFLPSFVPYFFLFIFHSSFFLFPFLILSCLSSFLPFPFLSFSFLPFYFPFFRLPSFLSTFLFLPLFLLSFFSCSLLSSLFLSPFLSLLLFFPFPHSFPLSLPILTSSFLPSSPLLFFSLLFPLKTFCTKRKVHSKKEALNSYSGAWAKTVHSHPQPPMWV